MKANFTRGFAWVQIASGVLVMLVGGALAVWVWLVPVDTFAIYGRVQPGHEIPVRIFWTIAFLVGGVLAGAPGIVFGQLMLVFLDMRQHLAQMSRQLRRLRRRPIGPESGQARRLRYPPRDWE